ncbi:MULTISPECIES: FtsB family cell division protein [Empedobacter]|uniref:FtsB family cell division protein n=1 Tax=Empedobacter TaxID=59734 RepID=UPI001C8EDBA4|nr:MULTISPECIES: septum formation initiator family protein [Empedobacter]MBY0067263.1 septum formation initiator family protein [Empedobacter falsenii]MDH0673999.1 septum formation initiator family protein [Empedobacter sp. GD03861]MDM1139567.1 septum formation initiator family protein [Empedobacter sp. R132-2]
MKEKSEEIFDKELTPEVPKRKIKDTRVFKFVWNRYFVLTVAFAVWMIFFDQNSFFVHRELDKQIKLLEVDQQYYQEHLDTESEKLNQLNSNPAEIERIAREKHFLKKDDEDIFIIQQEKVTKPQNKENE